MQHNATVTQKRSVFGRERSEFDRGLSFFDAIYGFAITLLIANLDMPPASAWRDLDALLSSGLAGQLTGFLISFVVIAVFWSRNTSLLSEFGALDGAAIAANLVTALLIVLMPFTTQGISDAETSELPLPTALYAANVALALASLLVTREIGHARGLIEPPVARPVRRAQRIDACAQILVFVLSIPVAFLVDADWGKATWLALLVVSPVLGRRSARIAEAESSRAEKASA